MVQLKDINKKIFSAYFSKEGVDIYYDGTKGIKITLSNDIGTDTGFVKFESFRDIRGDIINYVTQTLDPEQIEKAFAGIKTPKGYNRNLYKIGLIGQDTFIFGSVTKSDGFLHIIDL